MNSEQWTLLLRQVLSSVIGPALVGYGVLQSGQVDSFATGMITVLGVLTTGITMAYGQWKKSRTQIIKTAAAQSTVAAPVTIITDATTADKLPDNVLSVDTAKVVKATSSSPSIDPGPPPAPKPAGVTLKSHAWFALPLALALLIPLMACAKNPDGTINWTLTTQNYVAGANATKGVLAEIGNDLVTIDCMSASLVQVIAKDAGAAQRVQSALDRNAQIARDACPLLTGKPAIQVVAGA